MGVDGGGTRTRVALVDGAGRECARAEGPPTLIDPADPKATMGVIVDLCREVAATGGAEPPVEGLWAGIAGAGTELMRGVVETALGEAGLSLRTSVGADAEATFHDAFPSGPGILLISGTGSIALARGADARKFGWGAGGAIWGMREAAIASERPLCGHSFEAKTGVACPPSFEIRSSRP